MRFIAKYYDLLGFTLLIIALVAFKAGYLSLPYFWDELGVYAPGALEMSDKGIGMLPSSLDPEFSRGHPLLCYAVFGTAFRMFGNSVFTGHATALFIACLALTAFFFFARRIFDGGIALLTSLLIALQPMFLALSLFILPEMLLFLFTILTLWGLAERRWWLYLISCTLAILTKESALVLVGVAASYQLLSALKGRRLLTLSSWKHYLLSVLPLGVYVLFLLVQKAQNGWYFFPLHTGYIRTEPLDVWRHIRNVAVYIFRFQGRWAIGIAAFVMIAYNLIRPLKNDASRRAIHLIALFVLLLSIFSGINYYLHRYIFPVIPFVLLAGVGLFMMCARFFHKVLQGLAILGLLGLQTYFAVLHYDHQKFNDCNDMSYVHQVNAQLAAIRWAEQQPWRYQQIIITPHLTYALSDRRLGYLAQREKWPFTIDWNAPCKYGIVYWLDGLMQIPKDKKYKELRRFQEADAIFSVVEFL